MISVLFVCTGNICRSPTAEGVFRKLVQKAGLEAQISCRSAATHAYHFHAKPDDRAIAVAKGRGVDISSLRSSVLEDHELFSYSYIIALDKGHERILKELGLRPCLLLSFAPDLAKRFNGEVADPYYGDLKDFKAAYEQIEQGCQALLDHIKTKDL